MSEKINKKQEEILKLVDKISEKLKKEKTLFFSVKVESFLSKVKEISFDNKYALWIIQRYINDGIQKFEDLDRTAAALSYYHRYKQKLDIKDRNIMNIKSLVDLENLVEPFAEIDKQKEIEKLNKEKIYSETEFLYEGPDCKVLIPKTKKSSIFWGHGTKWCTASVNSENYFERYNKNGPLIIFVLNEKDEKGREIKYQMHLESGHFMDANDSSFRYRLSENLEKFSDNQFFKKLNTRHRIAILEKFGFLFPLFDNPTDKMKIAAISSYDEIFRKIENPSLEVVKYAIKKSSENIKFVKNLDEEFIVELIKTNKNVVKHIKNSEKTLITYLKEGGDFHTIQNKCENELKIKFKDFITKVPFEILLKRIKEKENETGNPIYYISGIRENEDTKKLEWASLVNNAENITLIKNPSQDMMIFALKNGVYFSEIKNVCAKNKIDFNNFIDKVPFYIICNAIREYPSRISYINDNYKRIDDLKWIALKEDPTLIYSFKSKNDEMIMFVLDKKPEYIINIKNPTKEMMETAFYHDEIDYEVRHAFKNLHKNLSIDFIEKAVKKHPKYYDCLSKEFKTEKIKWIMIKHDSKYIKSIDSPTEEMIIYYVKKNGKLPELNCEHHFSEKIYRTFDEIKKNPFKRGVRKLETSIADILDYLPKI